MDAEVPSRRVTGLLSLRTDFPSFLHGPPDADDAVQEVQRYLLDLKTYRNSLQPIMRLSEDVLLEIFFWLVHSRDLRTKGYRGYDADSHKWIHTTHVCQHWRAVFLRFPKLWTRVILGRDRHSTRTQAFLDRSKFCPITVETNGNDDQLLHVPILEANKRLKGLEGLHISKHFMKSLDELYPDGLRLPALESLDISSRGNARFIAFSNAHMPQLHSASYSNSSSDFIRGCLRITVTRLFVSNSPFLTLAEWLVILAAVPQLEQLRVDDGIALLEVPVQDILPPQEHLRVTLPNLQKIHFQLPHTRDALATYAYLLLHIVHPPGIRFDIRGMAGRSPDWSAETMFFLSCLSSGLSNMSDTGLRYQREQAVAGELSLRDWYHGSSSLQLGMTTVSEGEPVEEVVHLDIRVPRPIVAGEHLALFERIHALFPPYGLRNLTIDTDGPSGLHGWTGTLREAKLLDDVRKLSISAPQFLPFAAAVEDALRKDSGHALLPKLEHLRLVRSDLDKKDSIYVLQTDEPTPEGLQRLFAALAERRKRDLGSVTLDLGTGVESVDESLKLAEKGAVRREDLHVAESEKAHSAQ